MSKLEVNFRRRSQAVSALLDVSVYACLPTHSASLQEFIVWTGDIHLYCYVCTEPLKHGLAKFISEYCGGCDSQNF